MDTNGARTANAPGEQAPSPEEALGRLLRQLEELRAYSTHFVSAKVDGFIVSARQLVVWAALGVVGLIALSGLVVTSIVLFLGGAAAGLGQLCGGWLWLGQLIVGGGLLALLAVRILM